MSTAIILAGGRSSRSGRIHKGLRTFTHQGTRVTWLEYQIKKLRLAGYQRILLATGFRPRPILAKSHVAQQRHNPNPSRGPFSTLQSALRGFTHGHTLLVPLDNPVPSSGTLFRLRLALQGAQAVKPCFAKKAGHPLLLNHSVIRQLKKADPHSVNARLDRQLRLLKNKEIARITVKSPFVHCNLNSEHQWVRYKKNITI